jgi:virginiamycin B lyase
VSVRIRPDLIALEDRSLLSTVNAFSLPNAPNGAATDALRIVSLGGNLYFTTTGDEIGRITPTGQITQNFAPGGTDLAVGADGNLWTALGNTVERITPGGVVTNYAIPTPNAQAGSITAGADGNIWFEETSTDTLGRINPTTGAITEFPLFQGAFYSATDYGGLTAGPDGNVWFVSPIFYQIGKITPGGTVTEYTLPSNGNQPEQITAGPDGNVYITQPTYNAGRVADQIGQITPSGQITEFALPLLGGHTSFSTGITTGPGGTIDFNTTSGLASITPAGVVTENLSTPSTVATQYCSAR